ncbi:hypothetical protein BC332_31740 [Capsicum chinense]|nr:hypothetical protein BC332_31740 [Capsicum chinense]
MKLAGVKLCCLEAKEGDVHVLDYLHSLRTQEYAWCITTKSRNKLGGVLPTFTGFGKLESLDFSYNNLNGKVELQLDGLNSLKSLNLSCEFPSQVVNFANLTLLDLSLNNISGVIPDRLGELSKLQVLILSANGLSGTIPQYLRNIRTLTRFAANQNRFVGNIPLGKTTYLRNLDLSFNNLNGTIPQDLLSPLNLQFVDLTSNNLEGPVPANISVNVIRLRLGQNSLNGLFPSASFGSLHKLGDISDLQVLSLQYNNLVGEIPSNISQLNNLQRVNFSWNSLNGSIPSSISSLRTLTNLNLQGNKLCGRIPIDISNLNVLLELQLGGNQLGGPIPEMPFSGQIPDFLARMGGLTRLVLSFNQLSGIVPEFQGFVSVETGGNDGLIHLSPVAKLEYNEKKGKTLSSTLVLFLFILSCFVFGIFAIICIRYVVSNSLHQTKVCWITDDSLHKSQIKLSKVIAAICRPVNVMQSNVLYTYYKVMMPCEYAYVMRVTEAGNMYSFGVIMLELLTGEQAIREGTELSKWIIQHEDLDEVRDSKGRSRNHGSQNREYYRSKSRDKFKDSECYHYGLKGHTKKFYRKLKKENRDKEEKKDNENCIATITTEDLVTVLDANLINNVCHELNWIVDSGVVSHMTSRKDFYHLILQNHVSNQYVDIDSNNDVVVDNALVQEAVDESNAPLKRSIRQHIPFSRYSPNEYVLLTDGGEPECYEEAMEDENKDQWIEAMQDNIKSLHENHTYELVNCLRA